MSENFSAKRLSLTQVARNQLVLNRKDSLSFFLALLCAVLCLAVACQNSAPKDKASINLKNREISHADSSNKDSTNSTPKIYLAPDSAFKMARSKEAKAKIFADLADLFLREGDTGQSVKNLEQAIKLSPNFVPYLLRLSAIYAEQAKPRCLVLSKRILQKARDRQHKAQAFFLRGIYYKEELQKAEKLGNKTLNLPQTERLEKLALANWDSAIVADWTMIIAYLEKGALLFARADLVRAKKVFQLAYRINHHHPEVYYWLGRMAEAEKQSTQALEYYRNSLLMDKDFRASKIRFDSLQKQNSPTHSN